MGKIRCFGMILRMILYSLGNDYHITLWLFSIAIQNGPFIDGFPIKTSIYGGFSMATLVITRWYVGGKKVQKVPVMIGSAMILSVG